MACAECVDPVTPWQTATIVVAATDADRPCEESGQMIEATAPPSRRASLAAHPAPR
jgi:hypothetical protein